MGAEIKELRKIREDLDILTHLYAKLVDKLVPEEEPDEEDIKAIRGEDETVDEKELFRVLRE